MLPPLDAQTLPELLDAAIDQGLRGIVIAVDGPGSPHDFASVAGIEHAEHATVCQAVQYTSGIAAYLDGDGFWDAVDRGWTAPWTIRDALAYARDEPASFAPGQG